MKNHPHLPPDIQLPDQETAILEFVLMGNNGKLEALVSSVDVHRHLGLNISYETWIEYWTLLDLIIPNDNAFYIELERQYCLTLDVAIILAEKANTEQSPGLLQWLLDSRDKDAPQVIARILAEEILEVGYGTVH